MIFFISIITNKMSIQATHRLTVFLVSFKDNPNEYFEV